jgi:hypothetical protein
MSDVKCHDHTCINNKDGVCQKDVVELNPIVTGDLLEVTICIDQEEQLKRLGGGA